MPYTDQTKIKNEIDEYFSKSKNGDEKTMYNFFKKEIEDQNIKTAHIDISITGRDKQKRKYVGAIWKIPNYHKTMPWLRIGVSQDEIPPSLELVLPIFHGDMPKLWSEGKNYFRLGIEYTIGEHEPMLQFYTNSVGISETAEIMAILKTFQRKIKSYQQK